MILTIGLIPDRGELLMVEFRVAKFEFGSRAVGVKLPSRVLDLLDSIPPLPVVFRSLAH